MVSGKVKWFDAKKGWGFLQQKEGGEDIFVHYSSIIGEGYRVLEEGETVQFELVNGDKGPHAQNVVRVGVEQQN